MDEDSAGRRRAGRLRQVLFVLLIAVLVAAGYAGFRVVTGPKLEGKVLWQGTATVEELGPGGWFVAQEGAPRWRFWEQDTTVLHNALTGQRTAVGGDARVRYLLTDGRYVTGTSGTTIHDSTGAEIAAIEDEAIGASLAGLEGLRTGEVQIVGASQETVVLIACYAQERELMTSAEPGTRAVMAGFSLADGSRVWARDTGQVCDAPSIFHAPVAALGALEHLMLFDGGTARVLRLDDGEVVASWQDTESDEVVLQDGLALHPSGSDTLQVTDLATGATLGEAECPGAAVMNPGTTANLSIEATLAVDCGGSSALLYDREAREFTPVDVPTRSEERIVPDGGEVLYDRYVLSRDGRSLRVTDALSGEQVAEFAVDPEMQVQTNAPRGRVLLMYRTTDFEDVEYESLAVDLRTGEMLVSSSRRIGPGTLVDPAGVVALNHAERVRTSSRYGGGRTEERMEAWVVGVEGERAGG